MLNPDKHTMLALPNSKQSLHVLQGEPLNMVLQKQYVCNYVLILSCLLASFIFAHL